MGAVTPQWSLSQTSNDVISVSRGMIAAATSDNVQVIALLACEAFGATLAMSSESCTKVHQLCSQSQEWPVIKFAKLQIGWRKGDCAWQLAQSDSGLRFLGLVACLMTVDHWMAAEALNELIADSAADKRNLPTSPQLKQLIVSTSDKLSASGFTDDAAGWSILINASIGTTEETAFAPSRQFLVQLVKSVSNLGRLGQARSLRLRIPVGHAAWTVAFLKWCLGTPPSVVLDNGKAALTNPASPITVDLDSDKSRLDQLEIQLLDEIGHVQELIKDIPGGLDTFKGMVRVRVFAQKLMLSLFGAKDSIKYRACVEALPYACELIPDLCLWNGGSKMLMTKNVIQEATGCTVSYGQIFPSKVKIAATLGEFLDSEQTPQLRKLGAGVRIEDLDLFAIGKPVICRNCPCVKCQGTTRIVKRACELSIFLKHISKCVTIIMLLSFVETLDPDGLQMFFGNQSNPSIDAIIGIVHNFLETGTPTKYDLDSFSELVNHAVRLLLGHRDASNNPRHWIMSSGHGQTLYPLLLETQTVKEDGMCILYCSPGRLFFGSEPYDRVESYYLYLGTEVSDEDDDEQDAVAESQSQRSSISSPTDMFAGYRVSWQIRKGEKTLTISLACPDDPSLPMRGPMTAIYGSLDSVFVGCNHDRMAMVTNPIGRLCQTTPANPMPPRTLRDTIGIVRSDQNEKMRFFAMTAGYGGVIRGDACLECCIKVAIFLKKRFVIC